MDGDARGAISIEDSACNKYIEAFLQDGHQLRTHLTPFLRQRVAVSDFPIELLYNKEVNQLKALEHKHNLACAPISVTF